MAVSGVLEMFYELDEEQVEAVKQEAETSPFPFRYFDERRHRGKYLLPRDSHVADLVRGCLGEEDLSIYEGVVVSYTTAKEQRALVGALADARFKMAVRPLDREAFVVLDPFYMKAHTLALLEESLRA